MTPKRRQAAWAVRTVVRESPPPAALARLGGLLTGPGLARIHELAVAHRVTGYLHEALQGVAGTVPATGAAAGVPAALEAARARDLARHLRVLADLDGLAEVLDAAGVPWLVFKGPVLAETVHPRPDLRTYHDLDVLVAPAAFPDAVAALERAGFGVADRNWHALRDDRRGQVHPVLRLGTVADLHWDLLITAGLRSQLRVDVAPLFDRAGPVTLGGRSVLTFGPVDTLAHLCLHAGLAGGHRLLWLKDIARAAAVLTPDWDEVVERATAWRGRLLVAAVLARARAVVDAPVPAWVTLALAGGGARGAVRALDAVWPPERAVGHYAPGAVGTRLLRDDLASSLRALAAKLREVGPFGPQVRRALRRSRVGAFAGGPLDPLRPSGSARTRQDYLKAIRDGDDPARPGR